MAKEVSLAISTIFLFNIIAVFLLPALGHAMKMSQDQLRPWAGTAINDTSSVVAGFLATSPVRILGNFPAASYAPLNDLGKFGLGHLAKLGYCLPSTHSPERISAEMLGLTRISPGRMRSAFSGCFMVDLFA